MLAKNSPAASGVTIIAPAIPLAAISNARPRSSTFRTLRTCNSICMAVAAAFISLTTPVEPVGLERTATRVRLGLISLRSSNRFTLKSRVRLVNPVTFPPGWARVAARPLPMRSPPPALTMGIVFVTCAAARATGVFCATMTSTLSRISSATSWGADPISLRRAIFNDDILSLNVTEITQTLPERFVARRLNLRHG